jgi:hypothetical protein
LHDIHIALLKEKLSESKSKKEEAILHNDIGLVELRSAKYDDAKNSFTMSLEIAQEIGNNLGLCSILFSIGHIHWQNNEKPQAMQKWIEVYLIAKEINLAEVLNALEGLAGSVGIKDGLKGWEKLAQNYE